jgi:hypothetical protein
MEDIFEFDSLCNGDSSEENNSKEEHKSEEDVFDCCVPANNCSCRTINAAQEKKWIESTTFEERFYALNPTYVNKKPYTVMKEPPKRISCHLCKRGPPCAA